MASNPPSTLFDPSDPRVTLFSKLLRDYPDFPKPGVLFKDMFSVFADKEGFKVSGTKYFNTQMST